MGESGASGECIARFSVLYTRPSTRKHKKWEADGTLECRRAVESILWSEDGRTPITRCLLTATEIERINEGDEFKFGSMEVQIQDRISYVGTAPSAALSASGTESLAPPTSSHPSPNVPALSRGLKRPILKEERKNENSRFSTEIKKPSLGDRKFISPFGIGAAAPPPAWYVDPCEEECNERGCVDGRIASFLRPHQKEGVRFIYTRLKLNPGGAILADDMGLGKSVQTIAACLALMSNPVLRVRKVLLAVPSSLVANWVTEFRKWYRQGRYPAIDVKRVSDIATYAASFYTFPFLICSYDMALRHSSRLAPLCFDVIVCDEAHRLKKSCGKLREELNILAVKRKLLLTGTPLQNEVCELHSLLDFARPGRVGTAAQFEALAKENGCDDLLSDMILRRGAEVNESNLPEKHEYIMFCKPSDMQKQLMESICEDMMGEPLVMINYLRAVANHPRLLSHKLTGNGNTQSEARLMRISDKLAVQKSSILDSGKVAVFVDMLASFRESGECAVVFSNYTQTLDLLGNVCRIVGLCVFRIDGSVTLKERAALIDKFNRDKDPNTIFLITTKAGGSGLNLTGASRLVLFDSDWNPANDLQAMARIWRDGQTRPCHIYRLVAAGTIDEKILQRQVKKTGLNAILDMDILAQNGDPQFRDEDIKDIFELTNEESSTHRLLGCDCDGEGTTPEERDVTDCSELPATGENEPGEEEDYTDGGEGLDEFGKRAAVSMGELYGWRHFSSQQPAWSLLLNTAGLNTEEPPSALLFAMHHTTNF